MTNEPNPNNTSEATEYENFERLAKKLFAVNTNDLKKIKEEEKAEGIEPDEADFEPETEDEEEPEKS